MEHFPTIKKLHTDVLEEKYGPVHSEVIRHDKAVREVHIVDRAGISRTYAVTFFTFDKANAEIKAIDDEIRAGGLIGKVFREHGYEIRKNVIAVSVVDLPESVRTKMKVEETQAKMRLSEFYAKKEGAPPFIYGVVAEVYSPDFRPAEVNEVDRQQDNPTSAAFDRVDVSKQMIWDRLGSEAGFTDIREKRAEAEALAGPEEEGLKEAVRQYLSRG